MTPATTATVRRIAEREQAEMADNIRKLSLTVNLKRLDKRTTT